MLGKNHVIKDLKKCDFTPMYEYAMAERERKKQLSKEVCSPLPMITAGLFSSNVLPVNTCMVHGWQTLLHITHTARCILQLSVLKQVNLLHFLHDSGLGMPGTHLTLHPKMQVQVEKRPAA